MIKAVVTDIEGTTSSLSFVKEVLFPYARKHLPQFVKSEGGRLDVAPLLLAAKQQAGDEGMDDETLIEQLLRWIDEDQKVTALKALQGLVWEEGYKKNDFFGHVYADAQQQLRSWHEQGVRLYVYSSGSVYAQKLLFGHTEYGDMTPLFTDYFDTHIGAKAEVSSYSKIVEALSLPASDILFLSDIRQEIDAAASAGMKTVWVRRDTQIDERGACLQKKDFTEIDLAEI